MANSQYKFFFAGESITDQFVVIEKQLQLHFFDKL